MMKMKINILILLLLTTVPIFANKYDAHYLKLKKEYILKPDGGYTLNYTHRLRYNTYYSFHRLFGETFIVYDPHYQSVKINKRETVMTDGKVITGPENAINEVLPSWASNSGAYNHIREVVVTHTGLEIGAVTELSYTLESRQPYIGNFQITEPLKLNMPVDELEIVFVVPNKINFSISSKTKLPTPEISNTQTETIYRYKIENVTPAPSLSITDKSAIPTIIAQTGVETLAQLIQRITPAQTKEKPISEEQFEMALELQKEIVGIRTINIPFNYQIFPLQTPKITETRNSGTPIEKAILFQSRLLEYGIYSQIMYKAPETLVDNEHANLSQVSELFVLLNVNNTIYALSPTKQHTNNPIQTEGYAYIALTTEGLKHITSNVENKITSHTEITLLYDKKEKTTQFAGTQNISITENGLNLNKSNLTTQNTEQITTHKGTFTKVKQKDDNNLECTIKFDESTIDGNDKIYQIELPTVKKGFNNFSFGVLPETFNAPIRLPQTITHKEIYTIKLPKHTTLVSENIDTIKETQIGNMELKLTHKKDEITVIRKISINTSLIQPHNYAAFAEMYRLWHSNIGRVIYLETR